MQHHNSLRSTHERDDWRSGACATDTVTQALFRVLSLYGENDPYLATFGTHANLRRRLDQTIPLWLLAHSPIRTKVHLRSQMDRITSQDSSQPSSKYELPCECSILTSNQLNHDQTSLSRHIHDTDQSVSGMRDLTSLQLCPTGHDQFHSGHGFSRKLRPHTSPTTMLKFHVYPVSTSSAFH